jgi:uncharacterized membrane protein
VITEFAHAEPKVWVLQPTRSLNWVQARRVIAVIAVILCAIGGVFAWHGLPLVMPFSGLEALAVAVAFYLCVREGERREVVRLEGDRMIVESGLGTVEKRHEFNRFWVRVELRRPRARHHPTRLLLAMQGREVELGRFLSDGERDNLSRSLINALNKTR